MLLSKDTMVEMLLLPQVGHSKLLAKQKESSLPKIVPLKAWWTWKDGKCLCSRAYTLLRCLLLSRPSG